MKEFLKIHGIEYGVVEHLTFTTVDNGREYDVYINEDYDGIPDCPGNKAFELEDWTFGGDVINPNWFSVAVTPTAEDKEEYPELHNLEFILDWEDKEPVRVNYLTFNGTVLDTRSFEVDE